jgi:small subunit ribosomal protein S8e
MALWQGKSKRKPSGGRLRLARKKRRFEIGRDAEFTYLGETRLEKLRTRGDNVKVRALKANFANGILEISVPVPEVPKAKKIEIKTDEPKKIAAETTVKKAA